ncbi:MAG: hypothetical protein K2M76_05825, partial [Muribaculaceae bacterium]|nr:hypothetical protein [Muribaculaceae bacterium]
MKNIDLVFGYLLHSPNGVSSVVRLLLNNKRLFLEKGIVCNFHVRGVVDVKQVLQPGSRPKSVIIKENLK